MLAPFSKLIHIDEFSATPKYQQLANCIIKAIEGGKLQENDMLPSINELSFEFEISRDTAEKGYLFLKRKDIIASVPGKGYYVKKTAIGNSLKIFLLFNKLSTHKKIIYDSLVNKLGYEAVIDFYIYNNDFNLFKKLISNAGDTYTHYIIIPHFLDGGEKVNEVINIIPEKKLILLDKLIKGIKREYAAVYEDFENDLYNALVQAKSKLAKYQTIKLIFPNDSYHPKEIKKGFLQFCQDYAFAYKVVADITAEKIQKGDVYINLMENDLVLAIEKIIATKFKVGKDIGVISYNETPLKKIILKGITTVSTDFARMGEMTAEMVLNNEQQQLKVPFNLTLRDSL